MRFAGRAGWAFTAIAWPAVSACASERKAEFRRVDLIYRSRHLRSLDSVYGFKNPACNGRATQEVANVGLNLRNGGFQLLDPAASVS